MTTNFFRSESDACLERQKSENQELIISNETNAKKKSDTTCLKINTEIYTVETDTSMNNDFVPVIMVLIESIQGQPMFRPCTALLDTGSAGSWIH
jgi:hypothetical protein